MARILLVDNDKFFLETINDFLSNEGHEVVTAENGLSALDILKTYVPDVIFVDLIMPKIDGKKLCKIVRKVKRLKDVFLVVLSSFASELEANIADLDLDGYIPKGPIDQMMDDITRTLVQIDTLSLERPIEKVLEKEDWFQRRAKHELFASKRHFESIVERSSAGILEITAEGRVVYANEAARSLIDVPEDKLLGSHFIELFPEKERQWVGELLTPIGKRPKVIDEDSPVNFKGHKIKVNVMPMEGGESTAVIVLNEVGKYAIPETARKVSRRLPDKEIEEESDKLAKENERLRKEIGKVKGDTETLQDAYYELKKQTEKKTAELTKENERLIKEVEARKSETEALHRAHGALIRDIERERSQSSKEIEPLRGQESEGKDKIKELQRDYEKLQSEMKEKTSELLKENKRLKKEVEEGNRGTEGLQRDYEKLQSEMKEKTSELSKENKHLKKEVEEGKQKTETLQGSYDKLQGQLKKQKSELSRVNRLLKKAMVDRKGIENSIKQIEKKNRTIFESIDECYYEIDTSGNFTFLNYPMRRMLGYSDSDLLGMNIREVTNQGNEESIFKNLDSVMKTGESVKELDWELLRKDGSKCVVQISVIPMVASEGKTMGFCGIVRDEIERRTAKEERLYNEKLQDALEKVNDVCRKLDATMGINVESCENLLSEMSEDDPSFLQIKMMKEQLDRMINSKEELFKLSSVQTRGLFKALSSSQSRSN